MALFGDLFQDKPVQPKTRLFGDLFSTPDFSNVEGGSRSAYVPADVPNPLTVWSGKPETFPEQPSAFGILGDTVKGATNQFVDRTQAAIAGTVAGLAEKGRGLLDTAFVRPLSILSPEAAAPAQAVTGGLESIRDAGENIAQAEALEAQAARERALRLGANELGMDILGAVGDMGLQLGLAAATRNPSIGAGVAGGQVFGNELAGGLLSGESREQATAGAALRAGAEVGTTIPALGVIGRLFGRGGEGIANRLANRLEDTRRGRALLGAGTEAVQEFAAGQLGTGLEYAAGTSEEKPFSDLGESFREGGIGGLVGGIVATMSPGRSRIAPTGNVAYDEGVASIAERTPENAPEPTQAPPASPIAAEGATPSQSRTELIREALAPLRTRYTPQEAGDILSNRLTALQEASQTGRLSPEEVKALVSEEDDLVGALREHERGLSAVSADPKSRLSNDELSFITQRRQEIRKSLETNRAARQYETEKNTLEKRVQEAQAADELIALASDILPPSQAPRRQPVVAPPSVTTAQAVQEPVIQQSAPSIVQTPTEQPSAQQAVVEPVVGSTTEEEVVEADIQQPQAPTYEKASDLPKSERQRIANELIESGLEDDTRAYRKRHVELLVEAGVNVPEDQRRSSQVRPIEIGETVRFKQGPKDWVNATVVNASDNRASYTIEFEDGTQRENVLDRSLEHKESSNAVHSPEQPVTERPISAGVARDILSQMREEGRVGDRGRYKELLAERENQALDEMNQASVDTDIGNDYYRSIEQINSRHLANSPPTQAQKPVIDAFRSGTTAGEILTNLRPHIQSETLQRFADKIGQYIDLNEINVRVLNPEDVGGDVGTGQFLFQKGKEGVQGAYSRNTREVLLRGERWKQSGLNPETLLHELQHAASVHVFEGVESGAITDERSVAAVEEIKRLANEFSANKESFKQFDKATRDRLVYATKNPKEFMAITQTSPLVQQALKKEGLWQRFVDALRRMFGISKKDQPLLERILEAGERVMEAQRGAQIATAPPVPGTTLNEEDFADGDLSFDEMATNDLEAQRYAAISERIGKGSNIKDETRIKQRQTAAERQMIVNIRRNILAQFPKMDSKSSDFNALVGRKAAEIMSMREAANKAKTPAEKQVLTSLGEAIPLSDTAKKVLKGQNVFMKALRSMYDYAGGNPKEIYLNLKEIPEGKRDAIRHDIQFIAGNLMQALGRNPSKELQSEVLKHLMGQPSNLSPEQTIQADRAYGAITNLKLELADALSLSGKQAEPIVEQIINSLETGIIRDYQKNHFKSNWFARAFKKSDLTAGRAFFDAQRSANPEVIERAVKFIEDTYFIPDNLAALPDWKVDALSAEYGIPSNRTRDTKENLLRKYSSTEVGQSQIDALIDELFSSSVASPRLALTKRMQDKGIDFEKYDEVPQVLRDAWGEYVRPDLVVASVMNTLGNHIAKTRALNWLAENGTKEGYVYDQRPEGPTWEKLTGKKWGAMENKYVNRPLKIMLDTYIEEAGVFSTQQWYKNMTLALEKWGQVNAIAKLMKTAGSLPAVVSQAASNYSLMLGELAMGLVMGPKKGIANFYQSTLKAMQDVFGVDADNTIAHKVLNELIEYQVLRDGVTLGEVRNYINKAEQDLAKMQMTRLGRIASTTVQSANWAKEKLADFYQLSDNPPKLLAYFTGQRVFSYVYPDKSPEQIKRMSADIVRDTYPTFSRAPPAAKALSRGTGSFVTWQAEVVRTFPLILKTGIKMMADGYKMGGLRGATLAGYGASKIAGAMLSISAQKQVLIAMGMMAATAASVVSGLSGFNEDDDDEEKFNQVQEDVSALVPDYLKYADLQVKTVDQNNNAVVLTNISKINPFGPIDDMYRAAVKDGVSGFGEQFKNTFFSVGMIPTAIIESVSGEDLRTGEEKSTGEAVYDALMPGQSAVEERYIKNIRAGKDTATSEAIRLGAPYVIIDGPRALRSKLFDISSQNRSAKRSLGKIMSSTDVMSDEETRVAAVDFLERDKEAWNQMRDAVLAADRTFYMDESQIEDAAANTRISHSRLREARDDYVPNSPKDDWWDNIRAKLEEDNAGVEGFDSFIFDEMEKRKEIFTSIMDDWQEYVGE